MRGDEEIQVWLNGYKMDALVESLAAQGLSDVDTVMQERLIELYADTVPLEKQQEIRQRIDAERHLQPLTAMCVSFSDVISELENGLYFFMDTDFDVDAVFGTHVNDTENDYWLNVYASYDFRKGEVRPVLDILLRNGCESAEEMTYPLNASERAMLLQKMEVYSQKVTGMCLEEYSEAILQEEMRRMLEEHGQC